jgi:hypothetical protein
MSNIVMPPTPVVLRITRLIEDGVGHFLEARDTIPALGRYESDDEAVLLFNLVLRDIEAIVTLARTDLVLLPAANVLARAVFEIALKAAWIVQPDDPFEREVRWLAHLAEEERLLKAVSDSATKNRGNPAIFQEKEAQIRDFRTGVARALPAGYSQLHGNPSVEKMLQDFGHQRTYTQYRLLAQYVHGGHSATWLYRRNLGNLKEPGEFISPSGWQAPFDMAWRILMVFGQSVLRSLKAKKPEFLTAREVRDFDHDLEMLQEN